MRKNELIREIKIPLLEVHCNLDIFIKVRREVTGNFNFYFTPKNIGIVYLKLVNLTCSQIIFDCSKIQNYRYI